MKKVLIGLALVVVLGLSAGAFYLYSQYAAEQKAADELAAAQAASSLIETITTTLQKTTPVSWVYDADETLMFAIRVSDEASATSMIPDAIAVALREKHPEGFAQRIFRDWMLTNKVADKSDYFFEYGVAQLQSLISEVDMMRYLTTIAVYGTVNGMENAAVEYFNRDVQRLNSWQCDFLSYAYNNPEASTTDYLASVGKTASQLDFAQANVRNAALEALLRAEVQKIPSVQIGTTSYTIKLSLAATQQQTMQASVDSYMRPQIDLASDGSYVVNASVAVLDNLTGLITAYVPGRTVSVDEPKEFEMNTAAWSSNFDALISRIAQPGQTRYSLQTVRLPNGDYTFEGTGQQWDAQTMATGVSTASTAIGILQKIKVMVLSSSPSLIQQVKDLSGNLIYEAQGPVVQPANNTTVLKLRHCFAEENVNSTTTLASWLEVPAGIISFEMTREYTIIILLGSGVVGGEVSANTRSELVEIATSIMSDVRAFYPTPKTAMYARTPEMANEFDLTYDANYTLLSEGLGAKFENLRAMPIESVDTRKEFEAEYERISAELKSFESFVSANDYNALTEELYWIRQERADAILKYSV